MSVINETDDVGQYSTAQPELAVCSNGSRDHTMTLEEVTDLHLTPGLSTWHRHTSTSTSRHPEANTITGYGVNVRRPDEVPAPNTQAVDDGVRPEFNLFGASDNDSSASRLIDSDQSVDKLTDEVAEFYVGSALLSEIRRSESVPLPALEESSTASKIHTPEIPNEPSVSSPKNNNQTLLNTDLDGVDIPHAPVSPELNSTAPSCRPRGLFRPRPVDCSPNYRGNWRLPGNHSDNISEAESCSLWMTNLNLPPGDLAYHQLLLAVRGCGRVFATVINPPTATERSSTSAAKLIFFDTSGAVELLRQANTGQFIVNGYAPRVTYNRIRTKAQSPYPPRSRVVNIEGPKIIVNFEFLLQFFGQHFEFQIDMVLIVNEDADPQGRRLMEWRFGSYRCQASSAIIAVDKERRTTPPRQGPRPNLPLWLQVNVAFGVDPCALAISS